MVRSRHLVVWQRGPCRCYTRSTVLHCPTEFYPLLVLKVSPTWRRAEAIVSRVHAAFGLCLNKMLFFVCSRAGNAAAKWRKYPHLLRAPTTLRSVPVVQSNVRERELP